MPLGRLHLIRCIKLNEQEKLFNFGSFFIYCNFVQYRRILFTTTKLKMNDTGNKIMNKNRDLNYSILCHHKIKIFAKSFFFEILNAIHWLIKG